MVKGISNIVESALPAISIASITASAFMGRKFGLAAGYDIGSRIARLFGNQNVAEKYSKASTEYWTLAKKDGIRDLTVAASFIFLGLASNLAGKALAKEEPKEEPGRFDNIPILSTLINYKKTVMITACLALPVYKIWKLESIEQFWLANMIDRIKSNKPCTQFVSWEKNDEVAEIIKKNWRYPNLVKEYFELRAQMGST